VLASLIVVFREVLEAGLIIGVVLAATQGVAQRLRYVLAGIAGGVTGAALLAVFAGALSNAFDGEGQEIFTAAILTLAVLMLSWHITFMARHGREMAAEMKSVGRAVRTGDRSLAGLAVVVAVAVMREGSEVVLFLFGMSAGSTAAAVLTGGVIGLALAACASLALYRGLIAIPLQRMFAVTNGLIALVAAGMAGQAAATLHNADILPGLGERLWNTGALLPDGSILGRTLHALVGYSAQPSGVQMLAFGMTLAVLAIIARALARPAPPKSMMGH